MIVSSKLSMTRNFLQFQVKIKEKEGQRDTAIYLALAMCQTLTLFLNIRDHNPVIMMKKPRVPVS